MKPWYSSKIIWGGVMMFLLSALQSFSDWYSRGVFDIPAICTLIISLLVIAARIWFTDTAISTPSREAKLDAIDSEIRAQRDEFRF